MPSAAAQDLEQVSGSPPSVLLLALGSQLDGSVCVGSVYGFVHSRAPTQSVFTIFLSYRSFDLDKGDFLKII